MNREQKIALCMVIFISLGIIISAIAVSILRFKFDFGWPKAFAGYGFMGIAGLGGIAPLFIKKDKGKVTFDERDKSIKRFSALAGFATLYLFVGLACMIPFCVLGYETKISITWLPQIFMGAALSSFYVGSITLLILYGRANKGVENE